MGSHGVKNRHLEPPCLKPALIAGVLTALADRAQIPDEERSQAIQDFIDAAIRQARMDGVAVHDMDRA